MNLLRLLFVAVVCLLVVPILPVGAQLSSCEDCYNTGVPNGELLNPGAATFPVICCFEFQDCRASGYNRAYGPILGCSVAWVGDEYRCIGDMNSPCDGPSPGGGGHGHCTIPIGQLCPAECAICWVQLY